MSKDNVGDSLIKLVGALVLALFIPLSIAAIGLITMIYGWGLTAKNWYIVFGSYVFSFLIMYGITALKEIIKYMKKGPSDA